MKFDFNKPLDIQSMSADEVTEAMITMLRETDEMILEHKDSNQLKAMLAMFQGKNPDDIMQPELDDIGTDLELTRQYIVNTVIPNALQKMNFKELGKMNELLHKHIKISRYDDGQQDGLAKLDRMIRECDLIIIVSKIYAQKFTDYLNSSPNRAPDAGMV